MPKKADKSRPLFFYQEAPWIDEEDGRRLFGRRIVEHRPCLGHEILCTWIEHYMVENERAIIGDFFDSGGEPWAAPVGRPDGSIVRACANFDCKHLPWTNRGCRQRCG